MPSNGSAQAATTASPGSIGVYIDTTMSPNYDLLGSTSNQVVATVNGSVIITSPTPMELTLSFSPTQVLANGIANGKSVNMTVSTAPGRYGNSYALDLTLPANTTSFRIGITGLQSGTCVLFRCISNVPSIGLKIPLQGPSRQYLSYVTLPHGSVVSGAFFYNGTTLPTKSPTIVPLGASGQFLVQPYVATVLLQSTWFVPGSIVIACVGLVAFALASLNAFPSGRRLLHRMFGSVTSKLTGLGARTEPSPSSIVRAIWSRVIGIFQPKKLLALFLLCSILMVTAAAVAGPFPNEKAYVVAAPSSVGPIHRSLLSFEGSVTIVTPSQDYSDFEVMSSIADFNLAVISDYSTLGLPTISGFIIRGLANVPVIVMDNRTDHTFATEINALYGDKVIKVADARNLTPSETQRIAEDLTANSRLRVLGLTLSADGFKYLLAAEGVLSFVLIFLGWAFLGSLASESKLRSDFAQLGTVVSAGVFVFVFSEVIYVTTSLLMAFPISLHAVISGAKDITAVGYLGFGGGSTPRLAAGFLGVILGIALTKGSPRIEKTDLAIISGIVLFILADPLFLGQFAFQALLLFFGNFAFGSAFTSSLSLKGFIYGVGSVFGGSVTPTYLMSAGKMLYFSGLVPFAYLGRMGRTTTTLVALLAALLIGDGGVRVGEMTPTKTVIAIVPGLIVGFAFLVVFLALTKSEKYVRGGQGS
jgi:hypothetical protein